MGYKFQCDHCAEDYDRAPPFMGELSEQFLKTADSPLTELFSPGQTVTLCRQCAEGMLL